MDFSSIKPVFTKAKVSSALVIDDAFDPLPPFDDDGLVAGFQLIEAEDDIETAFVAAGGAWPTDHARFSESIAEDAPLRGQIQSALTGPVDAPLGKLARAMFGTALENYQSKRAPLDALRALLTEVGVEPTEIGSKEMPKGRAKRYPLIFLDYYLGEDGLPSIEASIKKIEDVLKGYKDGEMPIVVLMSSELTDTDMAEKFRKDADLLGCQFKFVPKEKFTGAAFEFIADLADRAEFIDQSRVLSDFVKAWKGALHGAVGAFEEEIKSLDLQDFYFIWKKAGEGKNMRFGEHVSNLFDGYLRKQIEDAETLKSSQEKVNRISFEAMPPGPLVPSDTMARLAHAAAFKNLDPFPDDHDFPLGIDLGELFIRNATTGTGRNMKRVFSALTVISQSCDLEHGKMGTVLMVEGLVQSRTATTRPSADQAHRRLRVDIFQFEDGDSNVEDLIIEWDAQSLRTFPVATFHKDMREAGYFRMGRLRPIHALSMQQKFAANLTRVAQPDPLPVYRYGGMQVMIPGPDGKKLTALMTAVGKKAKPICIVGDEKKQFVIADSALEAIRAALKSADPAAFDAGAIEALRTEFDDMKKLRRMRNCELEGSTKTLGLVQLSDSGKALPADYALPAKVKLIINLSGS